MLNQLLFLLYLKRIYDIDNIKDFTNRFGWWYTVIRKVVDIFSYPVEILVRRIKKYLSLNTIARLYYEIIINEKEETITIN